jgi:hypothetical protein
VCQRCRTPRRAVRLLTQPPAPRRCPAAETGQSRINVKLNDGKGIVTVDMKKAKELYTVNPKTKCASPACQMLPAANARPDPGPPADLCCAWQQLRRHDVTVLSARAGRVREPRDPLP